MRRTVKVGDVMTRAPHTAEDTDRIGVALQLMLWADVRHLPVLRGSKLVGVLTERDVLAHRSRADSTSDDLVGEAMSVPPQIVYAEADLANAEARMAELRIGCLAVVDDDDDDEVVGILTRTDVLSHGARAERPGLDLGSPARAVMTVDPVTVTVGDYLLDAAGRMVSYRIRDLPVIDGDGRVVGMLTDRDVRSALGDPLRAVEDQAVRVAAQPRRVGDAMTEEPAVVRADTPLSEVIGYFVDARLGAVPVVDRAERLVGIVSYVDVLREVIGDQRAADRTLRV